MPLLMERRDNYVPVTIATDACLSGAFDFRGYAMLTVHMPAAWTPASIGFKVATEKAGTYIPFYDEDGALVQIDAPAVNTARSAPPEVANMRWAKLWSQNGSGVDVNQLTADRILGLDMKA